MNNDITILAKDQFGDILEIDFTAHDENQALEVFENMFPDHDPIETIN